MRPTAFAAFLILAAVPVTSFAQADPRLSTLDPSTLSTLTAIIDSARVAGLPSEPLIDKALEGASKRASPERIVLAVRNFAGDLGAARRALGAEASEQELVAGVGALRAGAAESALRRLKAARGAQSALLPLAVLSDLVAQGTPVDRAAEAVIGLAERGGTEAQFRELPASRGRGHDRAGGTTGAPAVQPSTGSTDPGRGNSGSDNQGRGNAGADNQGRGNAGADNSGRGNAGSQDGRGRPADEPRAAEPPPVTNPAADAPRNAPPRDRPTTPQGKGRANAPR